MIGAVVYTSKWGNCRIIAEAIKRGLADSGINIVLIDIGDTRELYKEWDFVVAGAPTRIGKAKRSMRRFLRRNIGDEWAHCGFAAFGTCKYEEGLKEEPSAAEWIDSFLLSKGLIRVESPFKAYVEGAKGPLANGEEDRAFLYGKELAISLNL